MSRPNPFQTAAHCWRFALRRATADGDTFHIVMTDNPAAPRAVMSDRELFAARRPDPRRHRGIVRPIPVRPQQRGMPAVIFNKNIANVSREEFAELMAIVRAPPDTARPLTDEDRWRREYLAEQERRRVIGYQPDLFTAKPVTRYHRHRPAPSWDRTPDETIEDKLERIAGDRFATFGPATRRSPRTSDAD